MLVECSVLFLVQSAPRKAWPILNPDPDPLPLKLMDI